MNNKTYDIIKNCALIAAPILTFIAAIVAIWNVPYVTEITATLAAIDTLIGGIVVVAKKIYENRGSIPRNKKEVLK